MTRPTTASLFDDEPGKELSLAKVVAQSKPLNKAQQSFQRLVAKIESQRKVLEKWQDFQPRFAQRVVDEIEPLAAKLRAGQRRMADLIDELLCQPSQGRGLTRVQRAKLEQLLMNLVVGLLEDGGDDDAALEALHDKYSDVSRKGARQSERDLTEAMLQEVFGIEVGDEHDAASAEDLLLHAEKVMQERMAQEARLEEERTQKRAGGRTKAGGTKAGAAQARRDQAAKEVSQSLRDVYRKLASALHPDREPDADARQRKTLLMQRVNQAYAANDLLTLLSLQLETEQIDAEHLSSVSPQRLAHYNEILREQLAGLSAEIESCILPFRHLIGWRRAVMPTVVEQQLSVEVAELRAQIRQIEDHLVEFRDPIVLRDRLKHYVLEPESPEPGEFDDLGELMDVFDFVAPMPPARKRRRR